MRRAAGKSIAILLLVAGCSASSGTSTPGTGGGAGSATTGGRAGGTAGAAGSAGTGGGTGGTDATGGGAAGVSGSGGVAGNGVGGTAGTGGGGSGGSAAGVGGLGGGGAAAGASGAGGRGGSAGTGGATGGAGGTAAASPIMLSDDGGWCWFEAPRALFQGSRLVIGSVASGWNDASRKGDSNVIVHDLATGTTSTFELHNQLEEDDHDAPAFLQRPDGRLLALYAKHGTENHFYYRLSTANNPLMWAAEQTFTPTAATQLTYSNLYLLTAESNRIYDFYRGLDASYKPSYAYSDDLGQTWHSGNVIINVPSTGTLQRPYARYVSNGTDTVHITYTEAHPRDFDNSVYHIYYKGGMLYRSDGTAIHPLTQGLATPDEGTRIFQGDANNVGWTVDVVLDPATARPHTVYSVQVGSAGLPVGMGGDDMRYRYARWDGTAWRDHPLAYAGTRLYSGEDDYTGLAALDPTDASLIYISTNANPTTGAALMSTADGRRHWEIFRGTTANAGDSWQWTPVTMNSTLDNLRPIVVSDGGARKVLLWLRGTYRAYTDYQQQVLMLILAGGGS
jgi:BNR repeat-containing family member